MAERNGALVTLDVLVGEWAMTLTDAWFLESRETKITGTATIDLIFDRQPPGTGTTARA